MEKGDNISTGSSGRQLPGNQTSRDQLRQARDYIERIRSNVQATNRANESLSRTLDEIEQRWTQERNTSFNTEVESIREEPGIDNSRNPQDKQTDREERPINPEPSKENFKRPRRGLGR